MKNVEWTMHPVYGRVKIVGNEIWSICSDCKCWVRVNKGFFGSIHMC